MTAALHILIQVVLPIFIMVGVGALMGRLFDLSIPTMSKLNFYVFAPALVFMGIIESTVNLRQMSYVALYAVLLLIVLFILSSWLFRGDPFHAQRTTLRMGGIFYNSGNYGFPLIALAFPANNGDMNSLGIMAAILMVQNLATFTLGVWMIERTSHEHHGALIRRLFRIPVLYAIAMAFLLKSMGWTDIGMLKKPLGYLADGLIPTALLTLGIQLARTQWVFASSGLVMVTVIRLLVSPLIAAALCWILRLPPWISAICVTSAGLPVAVNTYMLSAEYRQNQELASQQVMWTTLLSIVTIPIVLAIVKSVY